MKRNIIFSLLAFILMIFAFIVVSFGWFTMQDSAHAGGGNIGVIEKVDDDRIIEIGGSSGVEDISLHIRPGEVKTYIIRANNLQNYNLTINGVNERNNAYVNSTVQGDYSKFDLTGYTNTSGLANITEYNLYNGIKNSQNENVRTLVNGTNRIELLYPSDLSLYNTNDYYYTNDIHYTGEKLELFNLMVNNADITSAVKGCLSLTQDTTGINWDEEHELNDTINKLSYEITNSSTVLYLHLYFVPNVYVTYNEIVLKNSNPFLFQSLRISLNAVPLRE